MKKICMLIFAVLLFVCMAAFSDESLPQLRSDRNWQDFELHGHMPAFGNPDCRREEVRAVLFEKNASGKNDTAWDVSENGDGSVLAWVTGAEDGYVLHIGTVKGGKIAMPEDCTYLFCGYGATEIRFNGLADTAPVKNMSGMFLGCYNLIELDISGFDTSGVTEIDAMFAYCKSLTGIDISGFDTANVKDMDSMFYKCYQLVNVDVSGMDTSRVTDMGYMFTNCKCLIGLDVSGFDTANVKDMEYMFCNCGNLTGLDVSGFDTANVKDMKCMFGGCACLTGLDVSGFDTAKVKDMSYMFANCKCLAGLDVSGFDMTNVENVKGMFGGCELLDESRIRDSLSVPKGINTEKMFYLGSVYDYSV